MERSCWQDRPSCAEEKNGSRHAATNATFSASIHPEAIRPTAFGWCDVRTLGLRLNSSHCFVGRQLEFSELGICEASDALSKARRRHSAHLKRQSNGRFTQTIVGRFDHCRSCQSCSIEVRGQRHDQHGLKHSKQGVALPDHDRTAPGLFARTVGAKIGPPDLSTFHRRFSRSRASIQSPKPSSVSRFSSTSATLDRRSIFHRLGSGRRTTTMPTRSPGRSDSRRIGRRTPSWNSASIISMHETIAQAEQRLPADARKPRAAEGRRSACRPLADLRKGSS